MRLFAYRLALALGRVDVDAMLLGMTGNQLQEWMEFFSLDPWGGERADMRAALVAHTVAVSAGAKKQGGGNLKISDFMLEFGPPKKKPKQTASQIKQMFNAAFGHLMNRQAKPNE